MDDTRRAHLYRSLARLLDAGLDRESLCLTLLAGQRSPAARATVERLGAGLRAGLPLSDVLERAGPFAFPRHDVLTVRAAERVGAVPDALGDLADSQEQRARARRDSRIGALYAVVLLQLAVLAPSSGALLRDPASGLGQVLPILLPLDALLLVLWRLAVDPPRASAAARLILHVPFLGGLVMKGQYRAWFSGLHCLVAAGVPLARACREALAGVSNSAFRRRLDAALAPLEHGKPLSDVLGRLPALNDQVQVQLASAEPVGELDEALLQAATRYAEDEERSRARLASVASSVLYLAAALYVGSRVVAFYTGHFERFFFE